MKKVFLTAVALLSGVVNADNACLQSSNAIEIAIANGLGWNSTQLTNTTSVISPDLIAVDSLKNNYFQMTSGTNTGATSSFYNQSLRFAQASQFTSSPSWSGEFSISGKFNIGGTLSARLGVFLGANLGFSVANIPVSTYVANVTTNASPTPGTISSVANAGFFPISAPQKVTMKNGFGYGIMVGLVKDTGFGNFSIDGGVAFRSFRVIFPSAEYKPSTAAGNLAQGKVGFQALGDTADSSTTFGLERIDQNTYNSYYSSYTQVGFRFGGSLNFKIMENLSFGISVLAEIYGNKNLTITPNISSFSATPQATTTTTTATTATTNDSSSNTTSSSKATNINNSNMMYSTVNSQVKNVVTSVMMTLTYSIPIGSN